MYDFLNHKLKPYVIADCPSTDGYEVTNLISDDINRKNRGFLAYTAIKPPINIDIEFICPINVYYIVIGTTVGSQKSTGFECLINSTTATTICKVYTEDVGIIIYNRKYYSFVKKQNLPANYTTRFFKTNMCKFTSNMEKLRIRILRTKSSVPCIERIEIWGDLSRNCSEVTRNTIKRLLNNCVESKQVNVDSTESTVKKQNDIFNIPDEFIDPISCEIMSIPMTLPSGKTVDQITLEKHQESEAKWGRSASDPFTGQQFTNTRKPVLNTALKSRIDKFLIENSHRQETFNIQRTLGRSMKYLPKGTNQTNNCNLIDSKPSSSSNLDDLVEHAMVQYNIVRFTTSHETKEQVKCGLCKSDLNLYELECGHYSCRSCVMKLIKCEVCKINIKKSNIKKYHNL